MGNQLGTGELGGDSGVKLEQQELLTVYHTIKTPLFPARCSVQAEAAVCLLA